VKKNKTKTIQRNWQHRETGNTGYTRWRKTKQKQFRETGNIGYTRWRKTKHNTICVGHHNSQTNTNNINKTWTILQTTGGKDEPNIVLMWKS
jgi:hypothetical protein